jgi:hypothetical protein
VGKSSKFTKNLSQFRWAHLYAKIGVLIQASKQVDSKIRNEFEFENQTMTLIIQPNKSRISFKLLQYIGGHCSTL